MLRLPYTNEEYKDKPVNSWRSRSIRQRPKLTRGLILTGILLVIYIFVRLYSTKRSAVSDDDFGEDDLFVESEWHSTALARSLMNVRGSRFPSRLENVFFLFNELSSADGNLVALGCDMSILQKSSNVHFIILGAGRLSIEEFKEVNQLNAETCTAHFHDARIPPEDDLKRSNKLVSYAANAISLITDVHRSQAFLYTHSPERPKPNWFTAAIQRHRHRATFIELAQSSVASMGWMATLSASSLNAWNKPRIDVLVDAGTDAGSLKRLFTSLSSAHYPNNHKPLIMLDYDASLVSDSTYDFADSLSRSWPTDKLILKSRTIKTPQSVFESWYPVTLDSYVLLLRGTDEVSPWYYQYLLMSVLKYQYSETQGRTTQVNGISLQSATDEHGKMRSGMGDVGTPTLLFPNHFTAFHRTLRKAKGEVDQLAKWGEYIRDKRLVVIAPASIIHQDGTFVFNIDHKGDTAMVNLDTPPENTGTRLLDDAEWWRTIGPDVFVDGMSLKNGH